MCDAQEPARSTLDGREVDLTTRRIALAQGGSRNGLAVTKVRYNIRSSTNRLPEHLMVPPEVCGGQERARSTLDGREVDLSTSQCACHRRSRNGLTVTEVRYNIRSSTRRHPENTMVSVEVCDGREQARSTSGGREVDQTTRF